MRPVALPAGPDPSLLSCHHVNPPRLEPGTYAVDPAEYGRDRVTGTFVLSPGDVRGTRFVHDLVLIGCWSLAGGIPCLACEGCGALVAARTDDCRVAQETRLYPSAVVRDTGGDNARPAPDPFARLAGWDAAASHRPELVDTRRRGRGLRDELRRDDPPAAG